MIKIIIIIKILLIEHHMQLMIIKIKYHILKESNK